MNASITCPRCAGKTYKTARDTTYTQDSLNRQGGNVLGCLGVFFWPLGLLSGLLTLLGKPFALARRLNPKADHRSFARLQRDSVRYTCLICGQEWFADKWLDIYTVYHPAKVDVD